VEDPVRPADDRARVTPRDANPIGVGNGLMRTGGTFLFAAGCSGSWGFEMNKALIAVMAMGIGACVAALIFLVFTM
jgi:dolichol kinase